MLGSYLHDSNTTFQNSKRESTERVDRVAYVLRLLIAVEEAHLWTSKDLPKEVVRFVDSAVRLRKKGVGVMLVSLKISDFERAMRSAMNIIIFRTRYEGDLRDPESMSPTVIISSCRHFPEVSAFSLWHSSAAENSRTGSLSVVLDSDPLQPTEVVCHRYAEWSL